MQDDISRKEADIWRSVVPQNCAEWMDSRERGGGRVVILIKGERAGGCGSW
jgi:hypothetical protein